MVSKLKEVLNVGETCLHVYLCAMIRPGANGSQKWTLDFLKLELQMTVSYLWVLRIESRSVGRAAAVTTTATKPSLPAFSTSNLVKDNPKIRCSWRLKRKGYFTYNIPNNY